MNRHRCHWPGCMSVVPPKLWGCKAHWYTLPQEIRERIWASYRPGQEITKSPSREYIKATRAAKKWIEQQEASQVIPFTNKPAEPRKKRELAMLEALGQSTLFEAKA